MVINDFSFDTRTNPSFKAEKTLPTNDDEILKNFNKRKEEYEKLSKKFRKESKDISKFELISTDPLIFTISNFINNNECDHLIKISKDQYKKAEIYKDPNEDNEHGRIKDKELRNNSVTWLKHNKDNITMNISNKISKILNIPIQNAEPIQMLKYNNGQKFDKHFDSYSMDDYRFQNQRLYTVLAYLNNPDGGETRFDNLNKTIKPEKGKIVVFANCVNKSRVRHNDSMHTALPVKSGEKYAFNLWFHEDEYDQSIELADQELKERIENYKKEGIRVKKYYENKAKSRKNRIMKEAFEEYNKIVGEALKIKEEFGIEDMSAYHELVANAAKIKEDFENL